MLQENRGERAKRVPLWLKAAMVAVGCVVAGGGAFVLWKAVHKETEEVRMRRLVEELGADETDIRILADVVLYRSNRREEAKQKLLAEGKRAVPFLIEGLHHENGRVRRGCADLLFIVPTKQGIVALIRCLSEEEKPVPRPFDVQYSLEAITGYTGGLDRKTFDDARDKEKARRVWEQWWEEYKDRLVEFPLGLVIRQPDGTVIMLPAAWGPNPLRPEVPRG
jgi:hypothetical protein